MEEIWLSWDDWMSECIAFILIVALDKGVDHWLLAAIIHRTRTLDSKQDNFYLLFYPNLPTFDIQTPSFTSLSVDLQEV